MGPLRWSQPAAVGTAAAEEGIMCVLTVLVQVELRRPSAHVSDGAYDRQAIGQLLLVLVMVLLQQCLAHFLPELVPKR